MVLLFAFFRDLANLYKASLNIGFILIVIIRLGYLCLRVKSCGSNLPFIPRLIFYNVARYRQGKFHRNIILFQENYIAAKEYAFAQKNNTKQENVKLPNPNYKGLIAMCFATFLAYSLASLRETLSTAIIQDEYGLDGGDAVLLSSVSLAVAGALVVGVFLMSVRLAKTYGERNILLIGGYAVILTGILMHYPIGNTPMPVADANCTSDDAVQETTFEDPSLLGLESSSFNAPQHNFDVTREGTGANDTSDSLSCLGCPFSQTWCQDTTQIPMWQLFISFIYTISGSAVLSVMTTSTYSKVCGPRPQGFWIGILQSCNSLARITGPIWISVGYEKIGLIYIYAIIFTSTFIGFLTLIINFKNLAPLTVSTSEKGVDNLAIEDAVSNRLSISMNMDIIE